MGAARKADRRLSGRVDDGYLQLTFEGVGERRWKLPERRDRHAIGEVATGAKAWVLNHGATDGQRNYVQKVLSEAGYHEGTPRRHAPPTSG